MCSEFRKFLCMQLRDLQAAVEAEHAREVSHLRNQLAHAQAEAARHRRTSILKNSSGSQEEAPSWVRAPEKPEKPLRPQVEPPAVRALACLPMQTTCSATVMVASDLVEEPVDFSKPSSEALSEGDVNDRTAAQVVQFLNAEDVIDSDDDDEAPKPSGSIVGDMVDLKKVRRGPKRCGTAPAMLQILPSLNGAPRSLAGPGRSSTLNSMSDIPGSIDTLGVDSILNARSASRRPSTCSHASMMSKGIAGITFESHRPASTLSGSSTESDAVAFQVLSCWTSSWRKTRRMVRLDAGGEAEGEYPTLLEGGFDTDEHEFAKDYVKDYNVPGLTSSFAYSSGSQHDVGERKVQLSWLKPFMIQPSSARHLIWEGVGLILIIHDVIVIPLDFFGLPDSKVMVAMSWLIRVFWLADIGFSFLTAGLDSQGRVEECPIKVAKRYARTWLPLDILCVAVDWGTLALRSAISHIGVLRGLQLFRAVKLLRLAKAQVINDTIREHIRSEQFILIANIARTIVMMLTGAHLIACLWYGIGRHGYELSCGSSGWVLRKRLQNADMYVRYAWAFHWSLALLTGENNIPPQNMCERGFAIVSLFFFFLISCLFVSTITTSLTRLQIISSQKSSQLSNLRCYLSVHCISMSLAVRVQRNAQHALTEQRRRASEDSVELLNMVSEPLRAELHFEVHAPVLMAHAFFDIYYTVNPTGIQKLCHSSTTEKNVSRGDVVFSDLETPACPQMFFVVQGRLNYCKQTQASELATNVPLFPGRWASEANLWTKWIHRGTLKATAECTLLSLDAEKFQRAVSPYPTHHAQAYAIGFVEHLNMLDSTTLTDLSVPDQTELVDCTFPELGDDDEVSKKGRTVRLRERFKNQRTKTRGLDGDDD